MTFLTSLRHALSTTIRRVRRAHPPADVPDPTTDTTSIRATDVPDAATVTPDAATVTSDSATVTSDSATVTSDSATVTSDAATVTSDATASDADVPDVGPRPSRRRARVAGLVVVALVLGGGALGVAQAHKTVTLDVDGEARQVSTFAGSVAGLLDEQGVDTAERDLVAPSADAGLHDGDEVVVRYARALTVVADGAETTVWTTALTADEALTALALRGDDVRAVASRSTGIGRPDLSVRLAAGAVDVVVDGRTETVDGAVRLAQVLADLGVTVGEHDRVFVTRAGRLTVVVQRVQVNEEAGTTEIPFETVTEQTDELYRGQQRVAVDGVPGVFTTQYRVVLVDGVEESRRVIDEAVTTAPVTAVVQEGTRARPAPVAGPVVTGDAWGQLAACESGGNPAAVSRSGAYHGLYQFSVSTWQAVGGSGLPSQASAEEQTQRAQALQARSGWGQWPACAAKLGLL